MIIDAPGHKEFLKNMITGAANAEAALLLIDAHEGVQENSRRHGYLLNLLGIRQVAVLVNKMDLEDYSAGAVQPDRSRIPRLARQHRRRTQSASFPSPPGTGTTSPRPARTCPGGSGPTVLETLDEFKAAEPPGDQPLVFPSRMCIASTNAAFWPGASSPARVKVGRPAAFAPSNKTSTVKTIERWNAPATDSAAAGESIGITLTEQIFVERGAIAALETSPPYELTRFKARALLARQAALRAGTRHTSSSSPRRKSECEIDIDRESHRCLHARDRPARQQTRSSSAATRSPN